MKCSTSACKWRKDGKCLLFAGQTVLECKYRTIVEPKKKNTVKRSK